MNVFSKIVGQSSVMAALLLGTWLGQPGWAATETIDQLLETARQGTARAQYVAIDDLGERAESANKVVPVLVDLLESDDVQVRWRSARSLADYGALAESAAPKLRQLLEEDEPIVKMHAAAALGRIGDASEATVQALIDQITYEDTRVARVAIAALRNLKPDPALAVSALSQALRSDDNAVITHAMEALVEAGATAVPLLREALKQPETAYLASVAIAEIGPEAADAVPELTDLLQQTEHSRLLIEVLLALAAIGPEAASAAPAIEPLLEAENDATIPVAAAYALGSIGAAQSTSSLRDAADDPSNAFLRMVASWALAKIHPDNQADLTHAVDQLTSGLASEDATMRAAAAKGLHRLNAPAEMVAPALLQVADDAHPAVRSNVIEALASLGEEAVPRATRALEKPKMRPLALEVLTKLGPDAGDAVAALVDLLPSADEQLRSQIHLTLAAIGPAAAPATEALVSAIHSDDPRIRHTAMRALHEIGPAAQTASQSLLAVVEDNDAVDQVVAAWAISAIAGQDPQIISKILPVLEQGLSSSHAEVRLRCAESLADLGPAARRALEQLRKVAEQDDRAAVRAAAELAIQRISGTS